MFLILVCWLLNPALVGIRPYTTYPSYTSWLRKPPGGGLRHFLVFLCAGLLSVLWISGIFPFSLWSAQNTLKRFKVLFISAASTSECRADSRMLSQPIFWNPACQAGHPSGHTLSARIPYLQLMRLTASSLQAPKPLVLKQLVLKPLIFQAFFGKNMMSSDLRDSHESWCAKHAWFSFIFFPF